MSTVGGTNSTTGAGSSSGSQGTSTTSSDALGKDDFLKLLVAQMQNQDPMNPMDDTQSIAEMAQFSSLEQMTNIATSMDTLSQTMTYYSQQSAILEGAALIGKWVSGIDTDGKTEIDGTVEAVKWIDGDPQLQVRKTDGTLVDLEVGLITQVQNQQPADDTTTGTSTTDTSATDTSGTDSSTSDNP
ncbi:flagellar hook capping FlgD N-terminal domain-containing protein [Desulfosporosinus sp. PR]|uniref:flagellar hook capping FlgD N-terminal domain-containing protein n=1 Tax=Candidatus Desulfosporosinus nitrosoreducens TaxID=3401928 RepID=UPI0027F7A8F4|nr:flagellar hook capping FlgD N-terminal domain-containing protein [Desulfosporosinus sp. PR]MDQ7096213.1 flagellar hook capping FlgD N-terminal domain-containing protein [Desulfosporosinus sp. PR]